MHFQKKAQAFCSVRPRTILMLILYLESVNGFLIMETTFPVLEIYYTDYMYSF